MLRILQINRLAILSSIFSVICMFALIAISNLSRKSWKGIHQIECQKLATWVEEDYNVPTRVQPPIISFSKSLVVKAADEIFAAKFLPDVSSCRIIAKRNCSGLMDCASMKLKLLEAIDSLGTLNRTSVILTDYDAIVWGKNLIDRKIYSSLPGHKTWSTSLLGFGLHTNIRKGVRTAKKFFRTSQRDDVAFRAVKSRYQNQDIQPSFHPRGKAWPTKDPILALLISIFLRSVFLQLVATIIIKNDAFLCFILLYCCSLILDQLFHYLTRVFSKEYFVVPDDSSRLWISLPLTGVSSMIMNDVMILRSDLYGPFLTKSSAVFTFVIAAFEELGLPSVVFLHFFLKISPINGCLFVYRFTKNRFIFSHIWNFFAFFLSFGSVIMYIANKVGISEPGGTWTSRVHCNKVKCIHLQSSLPFLKMTWIYALSPLLEWSIIVFTGSMSIGYKKSRQVFICTIVCVIVLRCNLTIKSTRTFEGSDLPTVPRNVTVYTKNGKKVEYYTNIPTRIGKVETTKFNVGSRSLVNQKEGGCKVHPNWNKVIWMNAVCSEREKPRSIIFFDDDVTFAHPRDYMKLGLPLDTDATLIEDPYSPGRVVSYLGRFNLHNCSLLSKWLSEISCDAHKTLNDQPALNTILARFNFSVRKVRIPIIHRDRGSLGFSFKPVLPEWMTVSIAIVAMLCKGGNRYSLLDELILHSVITYVSGHHLKEIGLQSSSLSPYSAVRDLSAMRRIVQAQTGTYVIFEDYSGRSFALYFSFVTFLFNIIRLFIVTNGIRFIASISSGMFIFSFVDLLVYVAAESGCYIHFQLIWKLFEVVCLKRVSGSFTIRSGEVSIYKHFFPRKKIFLIGFRSKIF